jgi:uncharacterized protein
MRIACTLPFLLAACAEQPTGSLPQVGLANPAALYCAQQGGRVEIRRDDRGETGLCRLPNGQLVDAQSFFQASEGTANRS